LLPRCCQQRLSGLGLALRRLEIAAQTIALLGIVVIDDLADGLLIKETIRFPTSSDTPRARERLVPLTALAFHRPAVGSQKCETTVLRAVSLGPMRLSCLSFFTALYWLKDTVLAPDDRSTSISSAGSSLFVCLYCCFALSLEEYGRQHREIKGLGHHGK